MMLKYYLDKANTKNLCKTLENKYPEILKSMKKEKYELEYPTYEYLHEIKSGDKVVGIIALQKLKEITLRYAISEFYIIPKYRTKEIIHESIVEQIITRDLELYIRKPSKNLIKILTDLNIATFTTNSIVVSSIPLICDITEIYSNGKLKKYYNTMKNKYEEYIHVSYYYDYALGCVLISNEAYFTPEYKQHIMITKPRKNDLTTKNRIKLKRLTPYNLHKLSTDMFATEQSGIMAKNHLDNMLTKFLTVDNLIGTSKKLDESIKSDLAKQNIPIEDGFRFRQEIIDALEKNEIDKKHILIRFHYLIGDLPEMDFERALTLPCPHCNNETEYFMKNCIYCGHNLNDNKLFKSVEEVANRILDDYDLKILKDDELQVNALFTKKLIKRIEEKEYNTEDVHKAQSLYIIYLLMKSLKESLHLIQGVDLAFKVKEGSGLIYGVNHGYVKVLTKDKYHQIVETYWDNSKIKNELDMFGIECESNNREELLEKLFDEDYIDYIVDSRFYPTKKGLKLLECELLNYYEDNIPKDYLFYEFKEFWDENIDKFTRDKLKEKFIKEHDPIE